MLRAMGVRRLASVLSVCLVASATVVVAQPKKDDPKAPAPAPATGSADGSGSAAGSAVQMAEDPPPEDMEGTNENPDAPKLIGEEVGPTVVVPEKKVRAGYPIEEVLRPITLPQNMSEVGLETHAQVSPLAHAISLRARYGITRQVQLGLTYLIGGFFANEDFVAGSTQGTKFHAGKAVGLDVTILLQDWIAVRLGVPVYIDPIAVGLTIGAPLKFVFTEKFALGGMDDLVNIKITKFTPSFYQEAYNAAAARNDVIGGTESAGSLRFSAYGVYQWKPATAIIGRFGINMDDFSATRSATGLGGIQTFIRAGVQHSPKKFLDLGLSIGFDDLAHGGTFTPQGFVAFRI